MSYDTNRTNISLSQIGVRAPNTAPAVGSIIYVPAAGGGWDELAISVPAANVRNALGIDNAETAPSWKTTLDATNPAAVSTSAAAPGTSLIYSHRDHVHLITVSGVDHGGLGGLVPDDDHTQYALLAGRSGGQTLIGGTASGNDLTLQSTSNATKGTIFLGAASAYDEANDRLGLGSAIPTTKLDVTPPTGSTSQTAVLLVSGSFQSSVANHAILKVDANLTGAGDAAVGIFVDAQFTPSATISNAQGLFMKADATPPTGVTITNMYANQSRLESSSSLGSITNAFGVAIDAFWNGPKPGTVKAIRLENVGAVGVSTAIGLSIAAQSGATNNYVFELPADATDPTGGGGAATGRIPCLIGGATRYLAYY